MNIYENFEHFDFKAIEKAFRDHPEKVHQSDIYGRTPIYHAIDQQRVDIIDLLIDMKCNINVQDRGGKTPLHWAFVCTPCNRDIIERLITAGSSGTILDERGRTPLHDAAVFAKDVNIINMLILISDPNIPDHLGYLPLHYCSGSSVNMDILNSLIDVTHDIDSKDKWGRTNLYYSCHFKFYKIISVLLENGANPFLDIDGYTPYQKADEQGKQIIDSYL